MFCPCGNHIPEDRLGFLQETNRPICCIQCSTEKEKLALMEYGHKTAGYLVIVPNDKESQRLANRSFRRAR